MYNNDTKKVLLTDVYKVGDKFRSNMTDPRGHSYFASFTVVDITDTEVVLQFYDYKDTEKYPKDKVYVEVPLTKEELVEKYKSDIIDFYDKIQYPYNGDHGKHSYDNYWYSHDIIEIVKNFKEADYEFIGYFNLNENQRKETSYGTSYDVGMIFSEEDENGNEYRYWCHFQNDYLKDMREQYKTFDF